MVFIIVIGGGAVVGEVGHTAIVDKGGYFSYRNLLYSYTVHVIVQVPCGSEGALSASTVLTRPSEIRLLSG